MFGYQVAFCYRNTAIYAGIVFFGILYGLTRDRDVRWLRWLREPLRWYYFVLLLLPMVVDGVTHMLGIRDDLDMNMDPQFGDFFVGSQTFSLNWWLRIATGVLAALGAVWFAYPRMERQVQASESLRRTYLWEAALKLALADKRRRSGEQSSAATN